MKQKVKIIRLQDDLSVVLSDGSILTYNNCTDELHKKIIKLEDNEEEIKKLLVPKQVSLEEEIKEKNDFLIEVLNSKYLTRIYSSIYIKSISELSLPYDFATAFYEAEKQNNTELIQSYLNFWTLCSLNPDSRARINLFWFLNKYGMKISKSGLFVAYRNVKLKSEGKEIDTELTNFISNKYTKVKFKLKESTDEYFIYKTIDNKYFISNLQSDNNIGTLTEMYNKLQNENIAPVYTDDRTGTFKIQLGKPVLMNRKDCDPVQENTCSRGLHVAGREWIQHNNFGKISIMVLVNPADVVAVPPNDNYGKMRTCAYYPVQVIERDKDGFIIDKKFEDGFEDDFISQICYEGNINSDDLDHYTINIPDIPELNRTKILSNLKSIKKLLDKKYAT